MGPSVCVIPLFIFLNPPFPLYYFPELPSKSSLSKQKGGQSAEPEKKRSTPPKTTVQTGRAWQEWGRLASTLCTYESLPQPYQPIRGGGQIIATSTGHWVRPREVLGICRALAEGTSSGQLRAPSYISGCTPDIVQYYHQFLWRKQDMVLISMHSLPVKDKILSFP